ncbi:unnamed protein product [Prorocentrum cordatum]|uniref:tRNA-splicing endonuclease subunit Sen54 N-terminal domain-containing protein n=1 Tax=Prorocentrum cordatum TaxID=2364126 RepID=A0ABN9PZF1_9DINO|nr:unnamed protein product [Polarella glacialis]
MAVRASRKGQTKKRFGASGSCVESWISEAMTGSVPFLKNRALIPSDVDPGFAYGRKAGTAGDMGRQDEEVAVQDKRCPVETASTRLSASTAGPVAESTVRLLKFGRRWESADPTELLARESEVLRALRSLREVYEEQRKAQDERPAECAAVYCPVQRRGLLTRRRGQVVESFGRRESGEWVLEPEEVLYLAERGALAVYAPAPEAAGDALASSPLGASEHLRRLTVPEVGAGGSFGRKASLALALGEAEPQIDICARAMGFRLAGAAAAAHGAFKFDVLAAAPPVHVCVAPGFEKDFPVACAHRDMIDARDERVRPGLGPPCTGDEQIEGAVAQRELHVVGPEERISWRDCCATPRSGGTWALARGAPGPNAAEALRVSLGREPGMVFAVADDACVHGGPAFLELTAMSRPGDAFPAARGPAAAAHSVSDSEDARGAVRPWPALEAARTPGADGAVALPDPAPLPAGPSSASRRTAAEAADQYAEILRYPQIDTYMGAIQWLRGVGVAIA